MNIIFVILMVLSFLLDGIISNIVSNQSIFVPLISLMSIIVLSGYYKINKKEYLFYTGLIGLFYDLIYTSTPVLNMIVFLLLGVLVLHFDKFLLNNIFSNLLFGTILIVLYRLITFIILSITNNIIFDINILFKSIYCSLLTNYIYLILMYLIIKKINNKLKNKGKRMKY